MSSSSKAGRPRKQKKVQTRIAFEPAASSPAEEVASPSSGRAPARVVYDSPKRSSFKAGSSQSTSARIGSAPRPSQAQLSFSSVAHSDNDIDDDGIPVGKKFAVVIRSPSANLSPSNTSKKQSKLNPASLVPKMAQPKSKSKLKNIVEVESSSDDHAESDEDEQPLKKLPKPTAKAKAEPAEDVDMDEEDEEPIQMSQRLSTRRKPSFLSDSDEEPLTKPPKAIVKDGEVRILGEPSPSPSPPPEDSLPKKYVNSRSFIAGGQLRQAHHKHDYEPIVVGRKHSSPAERKTKKKETITLSSDNRDSDSDVEMPPPSSRKKTPSKNKEVDEDSYDSEPAGYMLEHQAEKAGHKDRVFGKRVRQGEHPTGTPFSVANGDEEDDSIVIRSPTKRPHKSAKKDKKPQPPGESDSEGEVEIMPTPAPRRRLSPPPISDEDDMPIAPSQKTPAKKAGSKRTRSSSADSDLAVAPSAQKPDNKRRKPSNPKSDNDTAMVDLDGSDFENDSLFNSFSQNKKKEKKRKKMTLIAPMMVQAAERALKDKKKSEKDKPKKNPTKGNRLANRVRSSQPKRHRTDKEKAMELMRRKRNGEKITQVTDSEPDSDEDEQKPKMGMYDTDSEVEVLSHFEDEEPEEERNQEKIRKSLLPQNKNKHKESDDEDTFIVEDDDEMLGVPGGLHEIPIEFTNQAHKKLSEHFKDCVEWLVQRRINPGFNKDDPVYVTAFRKIDDDPKGLVNSKLISPVWNTKLIRSLKARPVFSEWEVGSQVGEGKKCDACNRGKHAASWAVKMGGKPYNEKTMEEIDQSNDEDEDEDEHDGNDSDASTKSNTIDASGNRLPSSKKTWYLGSTCRANAHAAHGLIHWKWFLDDWVLDKLKVDGWYSPERLAERALMKKKKLTQLSMDIVDDWTSKREMKRRYAEFKERLEEARNLTHERWGKK